MQTDAAQTAVSAQPVRYIRIGDAAEDDAAAAVRCYPVLFEDGRIRILTDGIDRNTAARALAAARIARRRIHLVVGHPVGIAADGSPMLAIGFQLPLFAYTIDDVELAPAPVPERPAFGRPADDRMVA